MILKVLCYVSNNSRSFISSSINIRRLNIQLVCNVRDVSEIRCKHPIVISSIEISFSSISSKNLFIHLTICPMIVIEEIVYTTYSCIGCHPKRVNLRRLSGKVTSSNCSERCCHCPWSAICHNLSDIQPIFSLKCRCKCIRNTFHMCLCLPKVGISHFIMRHSVKEFIITGSKSHHSKCYQSQIFKYTFHIQSYLNVMFNPITTVLI